MKRKPKVVGNVDSGKPSKSSKSKNTCRILIANGVNLDLLGQREAKIYGTFSLADIEEHLFSITPSLAVIAGIKAKIELEFLQTNDEKQFIESFASDYSGFLINAGAWTHTSIALSDRLSAVNRPFVEVHISNTLARETYRHNSYLAAHASGVVIGLGIHSYEVGLLGLLQKIGPELRES